MSTVGGQLKKLDDLSKQAEARRQRGIETQTFTLLCIFCLSLLQAGEACGNVVYSYHGERSSGGEECRIF